MHCFSPLERRSSIKTAGRWPWKPASAKECVTAHQPNGTALKMDEAQAVDAIPDRFALLTGQVMVDSG